MLIFPNPLCSYSYSVLGKKINDQFDRAETAIEILKFFDSLNAKKYAQLNMQKQL